MQTLEDAPTLTDPKNPNHWFVDKPRPVQILDLQQTLALIGSDSDAFLSRRDKWQVKSQALCEFMDKLEEQGYVYNLQALRAFEEEHGLPASPENGSILSILVYNAQTYRRADKLVAEGWQPGALLMKAGNKVAVKGHNILGGDALEVLTIREIAGHLYAMRPKKRKYSMNISAMPCKLAS